MKPCEEYEVWISAFLDGELSGEDRSELMQHMAVCQTCQRYFRSRRGSNNGNICRR